MSKAFEMKKCPRCGEDTMHEKQVMNALSRRDNQTYICSGCGTEEAFVDMGTIGERVWFAPNIRLVKSIEALIDAGRIRWQNV